MDRHILGEMTGEISAEEGRIYNYILCIKKVLFVEINDKLMLNVCEMGECQWIGEFWAK